METLNITLIDGSFDANDAIDLISKLYKVKIEYHENKIKSTSNAEDIKMREKRIKKIQDDLMSIRQKLQSNKDQLIINSQIEVSEYE